MHGGGGDGNFSFAAEAEAGWGCQDCGKIDKNGSICAQMETNVEGGRGEWERGGMEGFLRVVGGLDKKGSEK